MDRELTEQQKKAKAQLTKALNRCHGEGLSLRVYDGTVFVCPEWVGRPDEGDNHLNEETGFFDINSAINADGGAGV